MIEIAGHPVPIPSGALYDRYRSNTPLETIASEHPKLNLDWFRTIQRELVHIGFDTYSPNFYYKSNRISALYTADIDQLRAHMPPAVREVSPPLQVWPGRGLVVLTAYDYEVCDNDPYRELAISVVTARPGGWNLGPISLMVQALRGDFWGYVYQLPVDTELARVRGVVGYNLPKWLTRIERLSRPDTVVFQATDAKTGVPDLTLTGTRISEVSSAPKLVTTRFSNLNASGSLTEGHAVSHQLLHATSTRSDMFKVTLGQGPMSDLLRRFDLGMLIRYEYVPEFQSVLYAPTPLPSP